MRSVRTIAVLVLFLLLAGCSGGGATEAAEEADIQAAGGDMGAEMEARGAPADESKSVALGGAATTAEGGDVVADPPAPDDPSAGDVPVIEELPDAPAARPGDRVIKEGTVSVEVGEGRFDQAFIAVIARARAFDGDVVGSSTTTADNGDTFGSVTVRVPVENFEDLVVGMGEIGTVRNRDVGSQDVSAEFTDLEARLRHLQAQERFYLGLFDKADSVQDAISVQQQLEGIQSQIEQAQGRLNFLDDRTSFSTLTVELFEPGAGGPLVAEDEPVDRPSLARYWNTARDAFVNVVGGMLVVFLFLLPLLVPLAVIGALWMMRRRSRRAATSSAPVVSDERKPVSADH